MFNPFSIHKIKDKCPKCGGECEEIFYYFGAIRAKCKKCGNIFNHHK
jgi:rRNA maturation protein Nop10